MKSPLITLLWIALYQTCAFAQATNTVGTIVYNPALAQSGFTLVYPHNQPHATLINLCGQIAHQWTNDDDRRPGNMAYLLPNGDLIWAHRSADISQDPLWAGGGGATIERRTWNNEPIWSYSLNDSTGRLHHDFVAINNGHVIAIAWEKMDSLACIAAGRLPENLTSDGLWSERLIELQPDSLGGAEIVWEWRAWDHLIQDHDSTLNNFGTISEHPNRIDINFGMPSSVDADWLHMNSIDIQPNTGHILLSVPTFDELWIIDRNDTESGLKWRWGNPEAQGMGDSESQQLHYQHSAHWLDAPYLQNSSDYGKIAVFNNRNPGATGPHSSAHIIQPQWDDLSGTFVAIDGLFAPQTFDWTWTAPTPTDFFSSGLSNFERLPNGNNLILGGRTGEIFEFTATGDTAWYYRLPLQAGTPIAQGTVMGMNDNLLFRAKRYPAGYPAFSEFQTELNAAGAPIELNPTPVDACLPCQMTAQIIETENGLSVEIENATGTTSVIWSDDLGSVLCEGPSFELGGDCDTWQLEAGQTVFATVTDALGCALELEGIWLVFSTGQLQREFSFYPNPARDHITLKGLTPHSIVQLIDLNGRVLFQSPTGENPHSFRWPLPAVSPGLYFIRTEHHQRPIVVLPR
tara:strand:+ start:749 stop:2641 length:1893 start_codon:yes stop_codon:yes gene_type:complete